MLINKILCRLSVRDDNSASSKISLLWSGRCTQSSAHGLLPPRMKGRTVIQQEQESRGGIVFDIPSLEDSEPLHWQYFICRHHDGGCSILWICGQSYKPFAWPTVLNFIQSGRKLLIKWIASTSMPTVHASSIWMHRKSLLFSSMHPLKSPHLVSDLPSTGLAHILAQYAMYNVHGLLACYCWWTSSVITMCGLDTAQTGIRCPHFSAAIPSWSCRQSLKELANHQR